MAQVKSGQGKLTGRESLPGRPLPPWAGVGLLLCLFLLPALQVARRHDRTTGLTDLLFFGRAFLPRAIAPVRSQPVRAGSLQGYDGQFYAQLACTPLLEDPGLAKALDRPRHRARRILVPWLCALAGGGEPGRVLQACALVNLPFFAFLLLLLHRLLQPRVMAQWLCLAAAAWTTGALVSIQRALVDLPAAVLLLAALGLSGMGTFLLFAGAVLTREASWLGLLPMLRRPRPWGLAAPLVLFAGWCWYVALALPAGGQEIGADLGFPLVAHLERVGRVLAQPVTVHTIFEVLAPLSLLAQAAYVTLYRNYRETWWLLGAPFALLYLFLGEAVMAEQIAFCRVMLPLTLAFNLLLARRRGWVFIAWFFAGNLGLCWAAACLVWGG